MRFPISLSVATSALLLSLSLSGCIFEEEDTPAPTPTPAPAVVDTSKPLTDKGQVTLGAQSATPGSFLQIQGTPTAWTSGQGKPYAQIDAVFGADANGVASLMSPSQADGDGFNLSTWTTINDTYIADAGTTAPNSVTVKTLSATTSQKAAAVQGHYYALALSNGTYASVRLTSLAGSGKTATADVEIFK